MGVSPSFSRRLRGGFTLIEAAIAQVIVAFAVVAMCQLLASGTAANLGAAELSNGLRLTHPIHELATELSARDLEKLDGKVFSPPVNAEVVPLDGRQGWEQRVSLKPAEDAANHPGQNVPSRLHVDIYHHGQFVYGTTWLILPPGEIGGAK